MHTYEKLPQEIFDTIFNYLSTKEIQKFSIICKNWSIPARKRLYEHVCIKSFWGLSGLASALTSNTSLEYLVSTIEIDCNPPLKRDYENKLYDNLVLLMQHTPFVKSVKINGEIRELFFEALKNTYDTGQWKNLKISKIHHLHDSRLVYHEKLLDLKESLKIKIKTKLNAQANVTELVLANTFRRLEIDEIDKTVSRFPDLGILWISVYRLTDWNKFLDKASTHSSITELEIYTAWPTDVLFEYIYTCFPNLNYLKLFQPVNQSSVSNFILAEYVNRFANYLRHVNEFDISLKRLDSDIDIDKCFRDALCEEYTLIQYSLTGITMYLTKPQHYHTKYDDSLPLWCW
ncbi:hypothetical protein BD560DRAFT_490129 [Blakeslea trispora]|nr:hypothetical protein BD560DRAFT_490129 [Blakeslea trispora]